MPIYENTVWIRHCSTCNEWSRIKDDELETIKSDVDPNQIVEAKESAKQ